MTGNAVSSLLRANQAYYELLAQMHTLRWGIAFCNPHLSLLPEAAQIREVVIEDRTLFSEAFEAVQGFFHEQGMVCRRWAPAIDQPSDALGEFLAGHGYRSREVAAMVLPEWPRIRPPQGVRVLPARPMRQAYRRTHLAEASDPVALCRAEAALALLDEASMTMLVAMDGDTSVGRGGLLEVGDIGLITDVYVVPEARRRGVGQALMSQITNTARQFGVRRVVAQVDTDNAPAVAFLSNSGFIQDGATREFDLANP